MKTTASLSLRSLSSRIHPPFPLNPRDSQKLLSLIKSSFRQQLDREHPSPATTEIHATDNHFHSILTNPLFKAATQKRRSSTVSQRNEHGTSILSLQSLVNRPLEHFSEQVSLGTASLETASHCLDAQLKNIAASPHGEPGDLLKSSQAAAIVLNWLWSSGIERSTRFLADRGFVNALIPFLVMEGREEVALEWLKRLQHEMTEIESPRARTMLQIASMQAHILLQMVLAKTRYEETPAGAVQIFVQVSNLLRSSSPTVRSCCRKILGPAAKSLSCTLTQIDANIRPIVFTSFIRQIELWSSKGSYYHALLWLRCPTCPEGLTALKYIKGIDPQKLENYSVRGRRHLIQLCLDTAQVLLTQHREVDVAWLLGFLQENFHREIGSVQPQTTRTKHEERPEEIDEATNLRLLEALAVH
ncbi:Saccharopine dehydrogenase [Schaereria dolodes]|nr:Saccharopine dehydrogenase [Schaereria dolodes]